MAVTNYHTVNGHLIGETTAGVRTDYLTDALGSITATVNESAQIINTYRYKPFGERLAKTGSGADPRFQFTGDTGSVTTSRRYAENYNRRRSLDVKNGRWGSVDPVWPIEAAYSYAKSNPATYVDPSGLTCGGGLLTGGYDHYWLPSCPPIHMPYKHPCEADPCGYVVRTNQVKPGEVAFVACCLGKAYTCVQGVGGDPGVVHCAKKHEECHAANGTCDSVDMSGCRGRTRKNRELGGGYFDIGSGIEECRCYLAEAKCLENELIYRKCFPRQPSDRGWGVRCGPLIRGLMATCGSGAEDCADGLSRDRVELRKLCEKYGVN